VTALLLDVSRWQSGLDLNRVRDAGFTAVNIQLTGKAGFISGPWAKTYADQARALQMGVCTYHWLDATRTGAAHAAVAWKRITELGGPRGMAHQVDCEDSDSPATWAIWRDYVTAMQDKLQRHVINYSGDWWWTPRRWNGASLTPYHWAAPNAGYLSAYPGDFSPHWRAGYGGWTDLSIMQYAVGPAAGVRCSLSAIRDRSLWPALTGGAELMIEAVDGKRYPQHEIAVDADRAPIDPEEVAGEPKPDPWVEDPKRWADTEPVS
jgi:hypothetical protein